MAWTIVQTDEFREWFLAQELKTQRRVQAVIELLAEEGPALKRPAIGKVEYSTVKKMKEIRTGSFRLLFAFGSSREAVLLVTGDKEGQWNTWYKQWVPVAERRLAEYEAERK